MLYLLIPYILIFAWFCWQNMKHGLLWLLFFLPAYQIRFNVGIPVTLLEINILILFLVWVVKQIKGNGKDFWQVKISDVWKKNKMLWVGGGLFLIGATSSIFVATDFVVALGIWKAYFVEPILLAVVAVSVLNKKDFGLVLKVLGVQVILMSIIAIYQKITGQLIPNSFWQAVETRRVVGVFPYPNALALYLAPLVIMFLGAGVYYKKINWKKSLFCLIVFLLGLLAIYFTRSKGALLAVVAGIFFDALFLKNFRKYFVYLLVGLVVGGIIFVSSRGLGSFNLKGEATVEGGDSVTVRQEMWSETWQMLSDNWWTGAGLASYQERVAPYHQKDYIEIYLYPHNVIFNFWSEIGLVGLVCFVLMLVWFFVVPLKNLAKQDKVRILILKTGMFVLLVHGLVDVPYFKNDLAVLWWMILVGAVIVNNEKPKVNS